MFYEEKEINELVKCPYCKNKYNDPRILPCGLSMCYDCIQLKANHENKTVSCLCNQTHEIELNELIRNIGLAKISEKKANEVYRGAKVEELKQNLKTIKEKMDTFNNDVNIGRDKIIEYCNHVKNDVQLKTEKVIEAIKQHSFDILKQIDDYQNECLLNYDRSNSTHANYQNDELKRSEEFYAKWNGYLASFSITENDISIANKESKRLIYTLDKKHDEYKCKLFGDPLMKFKESESKIDSWLIGGVFHESFNLTQTIKRINNKMNKIHLRKYIKYVPDDDCFADSFDVLDLTENEIFVLMSENNNLIYLSTIDYEFNLVKQIIVPPPNSADNVGNAALEKFNKNNSLELVYLLVSYMPQYASDDENIVKVYDQNLDYLFEKKIKSFYYPIFTVFKTNFFFLIGAVIGEIIKN